MDNGYQMEPGEMKNPHFSDKRKPPQLGGILLITFLMIFFWVVVLPGRSNALQQSSPQEEDQIEALQRMLQTPMSPELQEILIEKLNALESMNKNQASALENAPEKPLDPCSEKPDDQEPGMSNPPTGMLEDIQPPFPPMKYDITTIWQDYVDGILTRVYAGALGEDLEQGVLVVTQYDRVGGGEFFLPEKEGALTIISNDGLRLNIQTKNGRQLIFDVAAMMFISSLDEMQPTITPAATFTPYPEFCP